MESSSPGKAGLPPESETGRRNASRRRDAKDRLFADLLGSRREEKDEREEPRVHCSTMEVVLGKTMHGNCRQPKGFSALRRERAEKRRCERYGVAVRVIQDGTLHIFLRMNMTEFHVKFILYL